MRIFFVHITLALFCALAAQAKEVTFYLTSNLAGRFPIGANEKDADSTIIRIAGALRAAKESYPNAYHFDLGNAFYPGRLSRFSFGSLTADYFQMVRLDAGIVAAADLNIGAESLEYIRRARGIRLVSANIFRDKTPLFEPYTVIKKGEVKAAIVGLTSARSLVAYEEAEALELRLALPKDVLTETIERVSTESPDIVVVLTSVSVSDAIQLLAKHRRIDIMICGGDAESALGQSPIRTIELPDGRRLIALPPEASLTKVHLKQTRSGWQLTEQENVGLLDIPKSAEPPPSFTRRLRLWQKWYTTDANGVRDASFSPVTLTPKFAADAVREESNCDVSFIEASDIAVTDNSTLTDANQIRYNVENDYNIFVFGMTGEALRKFYTKYPGLVYSGFDKNKITGYPIREKVKYRVCATQRGYELAERENGESLGGKTQWFGISDAVVNFAKNNEERTPAQTADSYFRLMTTFNLSNIYESGKISNPGAIETPPGQPTDSYIKWGLENDVNFLFYNRRHAFSFNPYIFYMRQSNDIIRNLLRGEVTYTYNTEWYINPYQRNRIDTVVVKDPTTGLRPSLLRETAGGEFSYGIFTGRLGVGLEKQILDPVNVAFGGIEATLKIQWEFIRGVTYKLAFDSFSATSTNGEWRNRLELNNAMIFTIASPLTFTVSHRYYYFYLGYIQNFYDASVFTFSFDLRSTWKFP
ncbi:MAG TPA: hypothetical protein PLY93_01005 [Turneriella sp.]|nr:hypothetical protein [Turneriella sp.]